MMNLNFLAPLTCFFLLAGCQSKRGQSQMGQPHGGNQPATVKTENAQPAVNDRQVGGRCECCEAIHDGLPEKLTWETQVSPPGEPGEPLEVSGTIFKQDGKTPAEGELLYVYHTDNQGLYSNGPKISKCAEHHGHLRGWVKTGPDGRYRFRTIRPASYANSNAVQHIHPILKEPELAAYWIDEFVFDDDPHLLQAELNDRPMRGGSGLMNMRKSADGTWLGIRDIVLGKNVPGY